MPDWKQIISGIVIGAILGIATTFFVFQGRITALEGKISKLDSENQSLGQSETVVAMPSCAYGIEIKSPRSNDSVVGDFKVSGTYQAKPPEGDMQLFLLSVKGEDYYPHGILQFDDSTQTWTAEVHIAPGNPNQDEVIIAAIVGKSGRVLVDYARKVGKETGLYPAIPKLTDDIVECDQVSVITR